MGSDPIRFFIGSVCICDRTWGVALENLKTFTGAFQRTFVFPQSNYALLFDTDALQQTNNVRLCCMMGGNEWALRIDARLRWWKLSCYQVCRAPWWQIEVMTWLRYLRAANEGRYNMIICICMHDARNSSRQYWEVSVEATKNNDFATKSKENETRKNNAFNGSGVGWW